MPFLDLARRSDQDFERSLIDSARLDAPPHDVDTAWARFLSTVERALTGVEPGSGLHRVRAPRDEAPEQHFPAAPHRVVGGRAAAWLLAGAIGGSGVTAALMWPSHTPRSAGAPVASAPVRDPRPLGGRARLSENVPPPRDRSAPPEPGPGPRLRASRAGEPTAQGSLGPGMEDRSFEVEPPSFANGPAQEPDQDSPSTLGAEVARLDEARTASRAGDHGEAIRIVEDYRREFPNGALAPDAEVVALEALAKLGERAEVARRAARFLARYPNDPHAGRAKRLAGLH